MQIGGLVVDVDTPAHPFWPFSSSRRDTRKAQGVIRRIRIQEMIFSATTDDATDTLNRQTSIKKTVRAVISVP